MSKLVLVDHEGRMLLDNTPSNHAAETQQEDDLHTIAQREAQRQSTKKKEAQ